MASKFALLIGIDSYDNDEFVNLEYAVKDIELIKEKLVEISDFDHFNMQVLNDNSPEPPTSINILEELKSLLLKVEKNDILLIYFSGHGFTYDESDYLVPKDGSKKYIERTCISIEEIINQLRGKGIQKTLFIIDACRKIIATGERGFSDFPLNITEFNEINNIITIYSCQKGEISRESNDLTHGIFSYYFVKAFNTFLLQNPNEISVLDLFKFVKKNVSKETNKSQTPEINITNLVNFKKSASNFIIVSKKIIIEKYVNEIRTWIQDNVTKPYEYLGTSTVIKVPNRIASEVVPKVIDEIIGKPKVSFNIEEKGGFSIININCLVNGGD